MANTKSAEKAARQSTAHRARNDALTSHLRSAIRKATLALKAGKQIQYVGVIGAVVFNKYHNAAGEFAANVFAADGSASRVGTISGSKVLGLL